MREFGIDGDTLTPLVFGYRRRHLDESQRAMVAARLANMRQGERTDLAQKCASTQAEAAELLNVGRSSVQAARTVLTKAAPELAAAVDQGLLPVTLAARLAARRTGPSWPIEKRVGMSRKKPLVPDWQPG